MFSESEEAALGGDLFGSVELSGQSGFPRFGDCFEVSIVGGTGMYADAKGSMELCNPSNENDNISQGVLNFA